MQALLFAALLANARAHVDGDRVLRAGRRRAARRCCCSSASTRCSASPPCSARLALLVLARRLRPDPWFFAGARAHRRGRRRLPARPDARVRRSADRVPEPPAGWWQYARHGRGPSPSLLAALVAGARAPAVGACGRRHGRRRVLTGALVAAGGLRVLVCGSRSAASSPPTTPTRCGRSRNFYLTLPALLAALLGLRALRPPRLLARRRRCSSTRHGLLVLLLLQDSHRPGSLLDGAPVPAGHPAGGAALRRGGGARRQRAARWAPTRLVRQADRRRLRRAAGGAVRPRAAAGARARRVRGHHPRLEATRGAGRRRRPADRRVARRRSDVHVLALPLAYIYAGNVLC